MSTPATVSSRAAGVQLSAWQQQHQQLHQLDSATEPAPAGDLEQGPSPAPVPPAAAAAAQPMPPAKPAVAGSYLLSSWAGPLLDVSSMLLVFATTGLDVVVCVKLFQAGEGAARTYSIINTLLA